ncbi:MAG: hypothetical protein ACRCTQ_01435 [Brevinemataceae bacterium]
MKKNILIALMLLITSQAKANSISEIYQLLEGRWSSPEESDISTVFVFKNAGSFTMHMNSSIDYSSLSTEAQESENYNDYYIYGKIQILGKPKIVQNQDYIVQAVIELNEETSTNKLNITKDKIYIFNNQDNKEIKTVFMERIIK